MVEVIKSPLVLEFAKLYYNCPSIKGIPLEDNRAGSAYSHWERKIFATEVMNPMIDSPMIISEFTIKLFEDMGFYRGATASQYFNFGRLEGCQMILS